MKRRFTSVMISILQSRQLIARLMAKLLFQLVVLILQLTHFSFQTIDHVLFRVGLDDRRIFDILRSVGIP